MATGTLAPVNVETQALSFVPQQTAYPLSPGAAAVSFLEFLTGGLQSLLSGENQLPCPIPPEFCAVLLRTDDVGAADEVAGEKDVFVPKGVPKYPLYKYIALGLSEWISTGSFPRTVEPMAGIAEYGRKSEKTIGWTQRVLDLGGALMEVCKEVNFQLHCQEPYFSQLKDGRKSVEGRCAGGYCTKLQVGDGLLFNRTLLLNVKDIKKYNTFQEMLEIEGLINVLPGVGTVTEGVQVYRKFYSEAKEKEAGVVGIHVGHSVHRRQPFDLMYDLLKEQYFSVRVAYEFLRNPCVEVFLRNWDQVVMGKLTVGARALAKHVHRCSDGWWGKFTGTEAAKNELSLQKLRSMTEDAIWMNAHVVPVPVFEIRVRDGYGARWSQDGSQFRGFLEPPMEEGYLHKWRH